MRIFGDFEDRYSGDSAIPQRTSSPFGRMDQLCIVSETDGMVIMGS